ncbi:Zinc finger RNA-binding protein 2 [Bienertia sinuspersici]
MSYFSGQSLHPSVPNPPLNYHQPLSSHVPPPFQSISSDSSFSNPYHGFNPYPDSGVYPSNYAGFGAQPINHSDINGVSPSWVVKQAAPIKYSPAIQTLRTEVTASESYETPVNYNLVGQNLVSQVPKKKIKRPKVTPIKSFVSQGVRCELCKIDCNTLQVYEKHLIGKKHGKGLQKLYASAPQASQSSNPSSSASEMVNPGGQAVPGVPTKPINLEAKKQKLLEGGAAAQSIRVCTICNVTCNGEIAFADHLVGKKHVAQERARASAVNSSNPVGTNAQAEDMTTKKRKNGEPAPTWCDVCKISCTSTDGLNIHLVGKKHQKNLQKLHNSNSSTVAPAGVGVEVKKDNSKDVESKKRNILESGAAANAVRTCTICKVVCNSDKVFNSHLVGHKHASMVKQAQAASASSSLQVVYPAT